MFNTYKLMYSFQRKELADLTLEDLVFKYQQEETNYKNSIYGTIFCKLFPMILKIQSTFNTLEIEEKINEATSGLLVAITKYKQGSKCKFSTYYFGILKNRLINCKVANDKRLKSKILTNTDYYDQKKLTYILDTKAQSKSNESIIDLYNYIEEHQKLNTQEKLLCLMYLKGYDKNKELAACINTDNLDYYYDNKLLKHSKNSTLKSIQNSLLNKTKNSIKSKISIVEFI